MGGLLIFLLVIITLGSYFLREKFGINLFPALNLVATVGVGLFVAFLFLGSLYEKFKNNQPQSENDNHLSNEKYKNKSKELSFSEFIIGITMLILVVAGFLYIGYEHWFGKEPTPACKSISKEKQVINKLDGHVSSVETETVYGCEYPDGSFLEYPNW